MLSDIVPTRLRSIVPWRQQDEFSDLQRSMNRMLEDFFNVDSWMVSPFGLTEGDRNFVPRLDLEESDEKFILSAELPGLTEADVEVCLDKDRLTVKGEKRQEKETKKGSRAVRERCYGAFQRTIQLPSVVDKEKISAKFDKGVLTVDLPKSSEAQHDIKKIPIKH